MMWIGRFGQASAVCAALDHALAATSAIDTAAEMIRFMADSPCG
jgi:hypothetical protein